jgi:hypothetical protein
MKRLEKSCPTGDELIWDLGVVLDSISHQVRTMDV